jgi:long-chain acyl-CoA synthetase
MGSDMRRLAPTLPAGAWQRLQCNFEKELAKPAFAPIYFCIVLGGASHIWNDLGPHFTGRPSARRSTSCPTGISAILSATPLRSMATQPAFTVCLPNGMNGTLSFAQVDEMSTRWRSICARSRGWSAGDRVALQMPNCLPFPVAAFAVFKAGCVLVNVNPLYTAEEMAKQFADSKPARAHHHRHVRRQGARRQGPPDPQRDRHPGGGVHAGPAENDRRRGAEILGQDHRIRSMWPHIRLPDAIAAGPRGGPGEDHVEGPTQRVEPDDIACLQYTGGTTGVSKGAMLSHATSS